jgi:hypothetical protein
MKALIEKSYEMGKEAVGKFICAPAANAEFMGIVPNCPVGDDKGCKLRIKMYNAYIKGWTIKTLSQCEA